MTRKESAPFIGIFGMSRGLIMGRCRPGLLMFILFFLMLVAVGLAAPQRHHVGAGVLEQVKAGVESGSSQGTLHSIKFGGLQRGKAGSTRDGRTFGAL